jgi:precorrin-4 methylase
MTTRLKARVSAAEEKLAGGGPNNAIRVYFVKGHPTHRAEELLRANGRDLSVPHKIVAFVTWADGAPVPTPLVDVTDRFGRDGSMHPQA